MAQHIGEIALLVRDYEEAIAWFTQKLGFVLVADVPIPPAERSRRYIDITMSLYLLDSRPGLGFPVLDSSRKGFKGNPVKKPELPPQLSAASVGPIRVTGRPS